MTLDTLAPSLIRTYVPVLVGAFIAWLITLGVEVDPSTQAGLTTGLTGLVIIVYYTVVRLLEKRWPFLSVLLGSKQIPAAYAPSGEDGVANISSLPATARAEPQGHPYPGGPF